MDTQENKMALEYANALMEYIKSEKDEHRLRVIEMGVRKMLEQELIEAKAKLEKYISVSDFVLVREAITDKLRDIKVIKVRDVNYDEATREVLDYYRTYNEAYPHEVADALELDYDLVLKITEELKRDRRLEVID